MKKEVGTIKAIPSKRLFLSIIADYDLNRSICELIDNSLDIWIREGKKKHLLIEIRINKDQQTIDIKDNAGGVKESELYLLVGPGQTSNLPTEDIIGIFGVGTKRAVVALAQDIKITSRYKKRKTYRLKFDEDWLQDQENGSWPYIEVNLMDEDSRIRSKKT
ncbi:MAG: ATP-binding protein, partial [DPANN group archaeon]|nr:ATP-binding protein [DPANN group archaeon]